MLLFFLLFFVNSHFVKHFLLVAANCKLHGNRVEQVCNPPPPFYPTTQFTGKTQDLEGYKMEENMVVAKTVNSRVELENRDSERKDRVWEDYELYLLNDAKILNPVPSSSSWFGPTTALTLVLTEHV